MDCKSVAAVIKKATAAARAVSDAKKQAELGVLLNVSGAPVHLISTPFKSKAGREKAAETKAKNHLPPHVYCYDPNTDAPQDSGGGWMASWFRVCEKTRQTNGTVHVVYNIEKNAKYGDGIYKGWFDGTAQMGEVEEAIRLGCTISWVGYACSKKK